MIDMDEVESLIKNAIVSLHTEGYFLAINVLTLLTVFSRIRM